MQFIHKPQSILVFRHCSLSLMFFSYLCLVKCLRNPFLYVNVKVKTIQVAFMEPLWIFRCCPRWSGFLFVCLFCNFKGGNSVSSDFQTLWTFPIERLKLHDYLQLSLDFFDVFLCEVSGSFLPCISWSPCVWNTLMLNMWLLNECVWTEQGQDDFSMRIPSHFSFFLSFFLSFFFSFVSFLVKSEPFGQS